LTFLRNSRVASEMIVASRLFSVCRTSVGAVCASPTFSWRRLLRGVVGHVVDEDLVGYARCVERRPEPQ
jgi:hypothetical protein